MGTLLITGGGGFVMSHLARAWADAAPGNRVVVLDAAPLDDAARAFFAPAGEQIRTVRGDVTDPAAFEGIDGEYLVHAAAVTSIQRHVVAEGIAGAVPAVRVNAMGTMQALAHAGRLASLRRFVNVSSGSVYASHGMEAPGQPLPEDGSVKPEGWYAASKYAGELLTQAAAAEGLPALSVRLSGVFGPLDRETPARAVQCPSMRLCHAAQAGRRMRLAGLDGGGDHIHAGDVAAAIVALLTCAAPRHPVYNIAHGRFTTLRELAGMVPGLDWQEAPPEEADLAADPALTGGRWGAYDISRIRADTGWEPRPLDEAVADYAAWLAENAF